MMGIGFGEMILIAGVALVVIGPDKFPEFAKIVLRTVRDLRGYVEDAKRDISKELRPVQNELRELSKHNPEDYIESLSDSVMGDDDEDDDEEDEFHYEEQYPYGNEGQAYDVDEEEEDDQSFPPEAEHGEETAEGLVDDGNGRESDVPPADTGSEPAKSETDSPQTDNETDPADS